MKTKKVTTPRHLTGEGRKFFQAMVEEYGGWEDEPHSVAMLAHAAKQVQRAAQYRAVIDAEGVVVVDRFGQNKSHPLLADERACHDLHRRLCRDLGITPHPSALDEGVRTPRILRAAAS